MGDVPEMINRIARALWESDRYTSLEWEELPRHWPEHADYVRRAQAAYNAMREPTEAMTRAAEWVEGYAEIARQTTSVAAQVWRDMAGAILAKAHVGHGNDT